MNPSSSSQLSLSMTRPSCRLFSCLASLGLMCCPNATLYGGSVSSRSASVPSPMASMARSMVSGSVLSPTTSTWPPRRYTSPSLLSGSSGGSTS